MKRYILLFGVVVFTMVSTTLIAQNGGMNIGRLQANESIQVGTASESVVVLSDMVSLPPLTDSEIIVIVDPVEGSMVYATDSDVILVFDGEKWKSVGGQNDWSLYPCPPTMTDIDGNTYNTALIGTQCWMRENLKVTHYPDGAEIRYIWNVNAWNNMGNTDDVYCYYNNNSDYGALYTYAASIATTDNQSGPEYHDNLTGQGICPDGWHLPTDAEWTTLITYLGGESEAGGKMKETGTSHWKSPNTGATNESGFAALPCGYRSSYPGTDFSNYGNNGYWWSATWNSNDKATCIKLSYDSASLDQSLEEKSSGYSVRCLRN